MMMMMMMMRWQVPYTYQRHTFGSELQPYFYCLLVLLLCVPLLI